MTSKIVTHLIFEAAKPIGKTIRGGRPAATVFGTFAGAALGTCSGFVVMADYVLFFVLVGAIVGATITAWLFKRPTSIPGMRKTDLEPFRHGAVLQTWKFREGEFQSLAVLLERALYLVREDSARWEEVIQKLSHGEVPDLPLGDLIRLDELVRIEMTSPDEKEVTFVHIPPGRPKRRPFNFQTIEEREEMIATMEQHYRKTFTRTNCPLDLFRAIRTPAILAAISGMFFVLVSWLSAHWTAHPPPPPLGKAEQDELVQFLIWIGPERILFAGSMLVLALLAWLTCRVLWPPRIEVISISGAQAK